MCSTLQWRVRPEFASSSLFSLAGTCTLRLNYIHYTKTFIKIQGLDVEFESFLLELPDFPVKIRK
jgi:hypothetical protein